MISETDALKLLQKYKLPQYRINHSLGVAKVAHDLALKIHSKHPGLPVDPQKVKLAGLLHDIGRAQPGDHEINTVNILRTEGLDDLADITMHGSYYEIMLIRGIDNPEFIPQTLENKIVAYADACFKDHPVSMQERWKEIELRRSKESEKIESLKMAKSRFLKMEKELRLLADESTDF